MTNSTIAIPHTEDQTERIPHLAFGYTGLITVLWAGTIVAAGCLGFKWHEADLKARRFENQVIALETDRYNLRQDRCRDGLEAEISSRHDTSLLGRQWSVHASLVDSNLPDYARYGLTHVGCDATSLDRQAYSIRYMMPARQQVVIGP